MSVYVLEVANRGVAALDATSREEAEQILNSDSLRADLIALQNDDKPVWDGLSQLILRPALPGELARFETVRAQRAKAKDNDEDQEIVTFLISVADPTDDFDDRDELGGEG